MLAPSMIIPRLIKDVVTARRAPLNPPRTWLLGGHPGTLLATEPVHAVGLRPPQSAQRFEYVTRDSLNRTITATGTLLRSGRPGPLIGFAPSTQGVARHCDPSYSCTVGATLVGTRDMIAAYEQPSLLVLLAGGADIVMIDYPRDPETGVQMYCDHLGGAHALEDAVTVARALGADGPLGLWGFSQGGGAVGAYLESKAEQPVAAVVGAPPAELDEVLRHIDGSMITGVIAYTLGGLMALSPAIRDELIGQLTESGLNALVDNLSMCTVGSVKHSGWTRTSAWSKTARPFGELVEELPAVSAEIARRRLGSRDVKVPVRLWATTTDDVIPFGSVEKLHSRWPSANWHPRRFPRVPGRSGFNHFAPYYRWLRADSRWLLQQLKVG